ncbi:MAG: DUF4190 domain-containing protein [Microbacteriaceae bacterium]|nr:DUF4190 domain-containing protein [Microbacteriaceae bacterium]
MTDSPLDATAGQPNSRQLLSPADANIHAFDLQTPVKANTFAIISLAGVFVVSLLGIVFGHLALAQIKKTGEPGRGLAIAGIAIGYSSIVLTIVAIASYAVLIAAMVGFAGASGHMGN